MGSPNCSRETTPFNPLHTWSDGRYRRKERVTLPPVRERSVYHAGQGSPLSLRRACPHSTPFHLHGLDLAWSVALNPHGRGRVAGTADGREGAAHSDESRSAEQGRGDRLAAPAGRAALPPLHVRHLLTPVLLPLSGHCPGLLMRALRAFKKWRHAMINLVEGAFSYWIEG